MIEDQMFVANAGIVLLAPYLPILFAKLELTNNDGFVDQAKEERAVHLLQYVAAGDTDVPEYELMLNKLLCGIPVDRSFARVFETSDKECEYVAGLLDAVIKHWSKLGNTSIDGLRTLFLQREGKLCRVEQGWHLLVEGGEYDMLLDSVPWSFREIKLPWMNEVLNIEWH